MPECEAWEYKVEMPNQKVIVITLELATFLSDDSSILFHGYIEQTTTRNQIGIVEEIH